MSIEEARNRLDRSLKNMQARAGFGNLNHRPKGRMCMSCKNASKDCSYLPFNEMTVLSKDDDGMLVVKCTRFERR